MASRIPKGKNELGSKRIFHERKFYKEEVYSAPIRPMDFWYSKTVFGRYYGRINLDGDTIYPVESLLTAMGEPGDETILALNFVAAAFEDFKIHLRNLVSSAVVKQGTFLTDIKPRRGWENINRLYHEHMLSVFRGINGGFLKKRETRIETFEDFVGVFSEFLGLMGSKVPVTKTFFATSRFCSPMISGLCIEISGLDHAKDEPKATDFINDVNFTCYVEAANSYGFLVDKNAPWRLVANVNSPVMKEYMSLHGFQSFYGANENDRRIHHLAHRIDYRALQIYLLQFYNSFVYAYPITKKFVYNTVRSVDEEVMIRRKQMTLDEFDQIYGKTELALSLYANTLKVELSAEPRVSLPNSVQMRKNIKNALALQKVLDINASIDYIYLKTTGIRSVRTGLTNIKYEP